MGLKNATRALEIFFLSEASTKWIDLGEQKSWVCPQLIGSLEQNNS